MRGALCVCSLVNQMLELLDRIRIGRFTSSGKEMVHAHRLLRKRVYSIFIPESIAKGSSVRSPAEKIHRVKYIE